MSQGGAEQLLPVDAQLILNGTDSYDTDYEGSSSWLANSGLVRFVWACKQLVPTPAENTTDCPLALHGWNQSVLSVSVPSQLLLLETAVQEADSSYYSDGKLSTESKMIYNVSAGVKFTITLTVSDSVGRLDQQSVDITLAASRSPQVSISTDLESTLHPLKISQMGQSSPQPLRLHGKCRVGNTSLPSEGRAICKAVTEWSVAEPYLSLTSASIIPLMRTWSLDSRTSVSKGFFEVAPTVILNQKSLNPGSSYTFKLLCSVLCTAGAPALNSWSSVYVTVPIPPRPVC